MFCSLSWRPEFVRSVGGAAAAISCVLAGVRRALLSLMAIGGVTPSDSGAASRFAAADRPFVCLSPPFVSFILANTPLSNPLCLPRVFIPPPLPLPLPEPCPRLTLPGLNCFRCPFGSGTAGAAAERRAPSPPPPPPLTASPLRPSQPHLLNDIVLFLHIFTVSFSLFPPQQLVPVSDAPVTAAPGNQWPPELHNKTQEEEEEKPCQPFQSRTARRGQENVCAPLSPIGRHGSIETRKWNAAAGSRLGGALAAARCQRPKSRVK